MEIELEPIEHPSDEQHNSGGSNVISKSSDRQSTYNGTRISRASIMIYNISKSRKMFCSCLTPRKMAFIAIVLFISLAITVGVLTVSVTTSESNETCQFHFKRTMESLLISGSQPRSVAVGDLNNDGLLDIVVANSGTSTVGIFISQGNANSPGQQPYSTGTESRPVSVVISDFNNDNHSDIAVANYATNNIGVFLGNGNGTFNDQNIFSLGSSHPLFVTVGDFNQDNQTDIVVANYGTNNIGILLGYGNGSFQNQTTYSTGYDSIPYSVAVGYFNNDNQLDIAVANYGTNNIGIFLGNGNGTFADQQTYTTLSNSNPSSIAVGDFNNDNHSDIVVSNNGTGNIGLFLGQGNGTFRAQITYTMGSNSHPQYISVCDFNKDNLLDIVVVDSQNNYVHFLKGYGNGSFSIVSTYDAVSGSSSSGALVADLMNDNQLDVVLVNYGTNDILLLIDYFESLSLGKLTSYERKTRSVKSLAVNDFNNKHILDIVFQIDGSIHMLTGLGNATFGKEIIYAIRDKFNVRYICVGDLNNDNQMDIVIANRNYDSVAVFLGHGDGTFDNTTTYSTGNDSTPMWVALGDFNNDNRLDIVSANTGTNIIGIFIGNGDGTFATMMTFSTVDGIAPYSVAVGDINNDNDLDLVVADANDVAIVFLGHGDGTFSFIHSYSTNGDSNPFSIALANFDSDNHLDIVMANTDTHNLGVFIGYGDGTFAGQTAYSTGSSFKPYYVIIADFNNDNISDIAAINIDSSEVVIFYGCGNGSFELAKIYSTGYDPKQSGILAAHLKNSKKLETVVGPPSTGNVTVSTQTNSGESTEVIATKTGSAPQPFSVAVGDFNNDNRSDVVVANSGTDDLSILLSFGNGTLGEEVRCAIGADFYPQFVITCDINKDNHLDIVSANSKDDSISIIMGYGNGSFAEQVVYEIGGGSRPYAVAANDLNNDNWLDLVIANEGTNSIGIFFGLNYTDFQSQETYSSKDSLGATGIVVGDLNNDSFLDIAAVFENRNNLGILLGYGNGSFSAIISYPIGRNSLPSDMAMGDFNKDNRLDIVSTNAGTNNVGVFLGYGNGSFAPVMTYSTGGNSLPNGVAVGDFNNDSWLDIVVANQVSESVGVLLGYGNGNFSIVKLYSTGKNSGSSAVTVGDFDNDGNLDIAVANTNTDNIGVLFGHGNGTFKSQSTFSTGNYSAPYDVIVGDFNNDNQLDIATALWSDNSVGILIGYGNGTFADIKVYSTGNDSAPKFLCAADFNSDKILDIAFSSFGDNGFVILYGVGDGKFLLGDSYSTGDGFSPYVLATGDFNNDTQLDVAVGNNRANNIGVFLADGSRSFARLTSYTTGDGSQPHSVTIGDLNNDGCADIVTANYGTDNIGVFFGNKNGNFDSITIYSTGNGSAPYSVVVADLNNDHNLDVVATNSETNSIVILFGCGNGTFASEVTYSTGAYSSPYSVAISDFNNDNISDIAVANPGISNILLLYGHGNGTFGNETSYSLGYDYLPYSIAVIDLNQDNWMDIVIACYGTNHVETLMKMC